MSIPETYSRVIVPVCGDASVLTYESSVDLKTALLADLQSDEVLVKIAFAGVNFIDTYYRSGLYKKPSLPFTLGQEGAGEVVAVGSDQVEQWSGKRVSFFSCQTGSYAQFARVKAGDVFEIPQGVDVSLAAAVLLQGCTAHYLVHDTYAVKAGDNVLVHAAAGGTGLLITQMAKLRGANVIGICGGEEKAQLAKTVGKCDHVIDYGKQPDWQAEVEKVTEGKKCAVVYDGVGKSTFADSLKCLKPRGVMASFGNASGAIEPIAPLVLSTHGSLYLTRPKLGDYMLDRAEAEARVRSLFAMVAAKELVVTIHSQFKLEKAAEAHTLLESRGTTGKLLINCQE